jgi:AcrR family transcriptional regulator
MRPIKPPSSTARTPQRSNGIKRREAILRAAAEIITEYGTAGLTLHATAKRAKSSIGSMYHFFSDKEELLDTLRERHRASMNDIMTLATAITDQEWQNMSVAEVIDALFGKPIRYYSEFPFALELHQLHEGQAIDTFMTLVESVITLRVGNIHGPRVARMLYAISTGTLSFVLDVRGTGKRSNVEDIPDALTAYLALQEELVAGKS